MPLVTVATEVLPLFHIPLPFPFVSASAVDKPMQTDLSPVIGFGLDGGAWARILFGIIKIRSAMINLKRTSFINGII